MPVLTEQAGDGAVDGHPRICLVIEALNLSYEMNAPELVFARFIAQRLEGNRDFDSVAIISHNAFRFHHEVKAVVFAIAFREDAVSLHAERIEKHDVSTPSVVEGV